MTRRGKAGPLPRTRAASLGVALLLILASGADGQDDQKKDINVDFTVGWGGCYRPMEWTPLLVGITTPFEKPLDCMVQVSASQNDLNNLHLSRREVLMPGRPREIPLVTKLAFAADTCTLTIYGTESSYFWTKQYELWGGQPGSRMLQPVADKDLLIGVSGRQGFAIMQLKGSSTCEYNGERGRVFVEYSFQRVLPADWTGYASLDLLLLYDLEWIRLSRHQRRAIVQWVTNGGRLLLVLGGNPLPADHELAGLLPFQIGQPAEVQLDPRDLRDWGCRNWKSDKVTCWSLAAAKSARAWTTDTGRGQHVLRAWGPSGFGKVGVCPFNPSAIDDGGSRNRAAFWVPQIKPLLGERKIVLTHNPGDTTDNWSYKLPPATRASNAVLEHLYSVEELRPIHIGWVVLVLVTLAILIGPADYLVLKKLGRLPLTWITASACIALFSVGAYYGVEYLRGGVLQARVVSVLDGVDGVQSGWATRYTGIFAPRSDDYSFTGLDRSQWWSGMAPTQGDHLYRYGNRIGSRNLYCTQHIDGGNVPHSVPINIWAMQCLLTEAPLAKMPFSASVRHDTQKNEWVVTVNNLSETLISKGYVLVGPERSVPFGPVAPGATLECRGKEQAWRTWESYVPDVHRQDEMVGKEATRVVGQTAFAADGSRKRTAGILDYVRSGAVVVCAEYDSAPVPFDIAGRKCEFQHKQLARLVVFPQ
ncbi:MAG: hypothetical protein WBF17_11735 [Phycisphaerae bacterium]